jgi:hypothetical protein
MGYQAFLKEPDMNFPDSAVISSLASLVMSLAALVWAIRRRA